MTPVMSSSLNKPKIVALDEDDRGLTRTTVALNFVAVVATLLTTVLFHALGRNNPTRRGFYCDDNDIRYPNRPDSISTPELMVLSFGPSIIMVVVFELLRACTQNKGCGEEIEIRSKSRRWRTVACRIVLQVALLLFGSSLTMLITDIFKVSAGRLRPNFLAVCQPDPASMNCSLGYQTNYSCLQSDVNLVNEARKSFFSGHASLIFFHMTFVIFYLRARISSRNFPVPLLLIQSLAASLASYVAVTRVTDYKHHASDVIAGGLLGVVIGAILASIVNRGLQQPQRGKPPDGTPLHHMHTIY